MADVYPREAWPGDADVSQLDGTTDEATGLPYIARGTAPTSDPPLEIQYNRAQQRLKQIIGPWNQGRVVDEGAGKIGVFPIRYWMNGIMQCFEGASGVDVPGSGTWMAYIDSDGVLRMDRSWPAAAVSYLPLAELTLNAGQLTITDARTYAAFRVGRDAALWPLAVTLRVTIGSETAHSIDLTVQVVDGAGQPVSGLFEVHAWLSDSTAGALTSLPPDGGASVTAGTLLVTEVTAKRWRLVTGTDGACVLRVTHSGARSWYLQGQLGGRIVTSSEIRFV